MKPPRSILQTPFSKEELKILNAGNTIVGHDGSIFIILGVRNINFISFIYKAYNVALNSKQTLQLCFDSPQMVRINYISNRALSKTRTSLKEVIL